MELWQGTLPYPPALNNRETALQRDGLPAQHPKKIVGWLSRICWSEPKEHNTCWDCYSLPIDQFAIIPVKSQDDSRFFGSPNQQLPIFGSWRFFYNRSYIIASQP